MTFCLFILFLLMSPQSTLQDVLDLYTQAAGGREAIEKVRTVEMHLTIQEPEFTVDGIYKADRNMRMRIDIYAGGKRVFTEGFDGENGWQMGEDGVAKDASVDGSAALRNGIFLPGKLFGLHELTALGHRIDHEGRQEIDKTSYYVLKLTLDSGMETFLFVHPETGRIERTRDVKALHPDIDSTKKLTESANSDFRKVNGVLFSFKGVRKNLKTGETVQTTTLKEVKVNPVFEDSVFLKPTSERKQ
ncbi:hypothetical protein L0222_20115 [bacterium]|nr:hypothetical protein [bacterium]MCI0607380.1 hypothetical protein [bacterium]